MQVRRIAFLNTHPIQYFAPLYAYLNASRDIAVSALYLSDYSIRGAADKAFGRVVKWDVDLLAGYDAQFIAGAGDREEIKGFFSMVAPQLWHTVRSGGFDALIVHGHTPAAMLVGIAAAKSARIPVFMRGETHLGLRRSAFKTALRRPIMRAFYRMCEGVFAIGSANAEFYRAMGVPETSVFSMPYTVDNARFIAASRLSDVERRTVRAQLGVEDDKPIILYAAKFQSRKRPDDLLRAAGLVRQENRDFHVVMVGSGAMEGTLRELAQQLGLENVHFPGFVNQSGLPGVYAACDVFVLPSEDEPWGLAVNEAMCAGLPVVTSEGIGCARDLVRADINGQTFPVGDIHKLAAILRSLVSDTETRQRMGAASRDIISHWSYAECCDGLREALAALVPPKPTARKSVHAGRGVP